MRMNIFLVLVVLFSAYFPGCRKPMEPVIRATQTPLLNAYAERNCIPSKDPQYVRDYSTTHGPALSPEERREFTEWQVK